MKYGQHSVGPLEEMILQAALTPNSGKDIAAILEKQLLVRRIGLDAMYHVLRRLQAKGYIASNGLRPRNYWATDTGKAALEEIRQAREPVSNTDAEGART